MFGTNSVLALPFQAAVKPVPPTTIATTGRSAIPRSTGWVWVGNADYTPMINTSGVSGAAPIWANIMQIGIQQLRGGSATAFARPSDVVDMTICSVSGTIPSEYCPSQRTEVFASDPGSATQGRRSLGQKYDRFLDRAAGFTCMLRVHQGNFDHQRRRQGCHQVAQYGCRQSLGG